MWEGLINLFFVMVIVEVGLVGIGELFVQVIEIVFRCVIKYKDLWSDKFFVWIGIIEGIFESWCVIGVCVVLVDLILSGFFVELCCLNMVCNGFLYLGMFFDV